MSTTPPDTDITYDLITTTRYDAAHPLNGSSYWLLPHHLSRLLSAADAHGPAWSDAKRALSLDVLKLEAERAVAEFIDAPASAAFKIRITLSPTGELSATATPCPPLQYPPSPSPSLFPLPLPTPTSTPPPPYLSLHLDTVPTPPSLFTRTKTSHRPHYSAARARKGLPPLTTASANTQSQPTPTSPHPAPPPSDADVLLYTPTSHLSESTIRNIALLRPSPSPSPDSPPRWTTPSLQTGCLPGVLRRYLLETDQIIEATESTPGMTKDDIQLGEWVLTFNAVEGVRLGKVVSL